MFLRTAPPQTLTHFSHADVPVTMGIVIDDSGSMRDKRQAVNAAALIFAKTSNPQDQVFVVNFNDVYYLDTPGDFASTIEDLKSALDKIDSRGGTALRDAVIASLDHLKLGNRDKKVLLVITDGEDNASRYTLEELMAAAQKSNAVIYTIGLLGSDETSSLFKIRGGEAHRAAKVLKELAEATGGEAYFPKSLDEVESTCRQIARDIRNQYTLVYRPTNLKKDGTFRAIRVDAYQPHTKNKLVVRTRPGYFAPKSVDPSRRCLKLRAAPPAKNLSSAIQPGFPGAGRGVRSAPPAGCRPHFRPGAAGRRDSRAGRKSAGWSRAPFGRFRGCAPGSSASPAPPR